MVLHETHFLLQLRAPTGFFASHKALSLGKPPPFKQSACSLFATMSAAQLAPYITYPEIQGIFPILPNNPANST